MDQMSEQFHKHTWWTQARGEREMEMWGLLMHAREGEPLFIFPF